MSNYCCFLGHRKIKKTEELKKEIYKKLEWLISCENVDTLLFGSKSEFNTLCHEITTELKKEFPNIKRVYVRAEYPIISSEYENYLLENYESTYYPEKILNAGRSVYVQRNFEMINKSDFCIFYFNPTDDEKNKKSGTRIALEYALKRKKNIIKFPN